MSDYRIESVAGADERAGICESVLRGLPEWFGIEQAIVDYIDAVRNLETHAARDDGGVLGFLSLKLHDPRAAEVYVMGVRREHHGRGIGTALLTAAEDALRAAGVEYLQVKTLGPSCESRSYARTRGFYEARGFVPLEELSGLWPGNPCLLLVKRIAAGAPS